MITSPAFFFFCEYVDDSRKKQDRRPRGRPVLCKDAVDAAIGQYGRHAGRDFPVVGDEAVSLA